MKLWSIMKHSNFVIYHCSRDLFFLILFSHYFVQGFNWDMFNYCLKIHLIICIFFFFSILRIINLGKKLFDISKLHFQLFHNNTFQSTSGSKTIKDYTIHRFCAQWSNFVWINKYVPNYKTPKTFSVLQNELYARNKSLDWSIWRMKLLLTNQILEINF